MAYNVQIAPYVFSRTTTLTGGGGAVPENTALPVITGTVRTGESLSCSTGTWTNSPSSYTYQWTRDGVDIGGATSSTYAVTPTDIPALIACEVIATNGTGDSLPATAASVSSPLRAIYQIDSGARVWVHTQGTGVTVGNPVATWTSADGLHTLTQATSSFQPTRQSGGLQFLGVDDWLNGDAHASVFNGAYTICTGADDVNNTDTNTRQLWGSYTAGVSTATRRCSHVNLSCSTVASLTRMRYLLGGNSSAQQIDLTSLYDAAGLGPFDIACRTVAAGAGNAEAIELTDPLAAINSGARPTATLANDRFTIGAERLDATPALWWEGTLRYVVIFDSVLTNGNLDTVRDALIAEGVI